jgi:hypothetical protein
MKDWLRNNFWPYGVLLVFLAVAGVIIQLHNISHYNVYPDSYQSVTVAQNLKTYHRLVAPMGNGGIVYPDFFGWTRPLYPFLIVAVSWSGANLFTAAHIIAAAAGVLGIFAVFALTTSVLKSKKAGLFAALLLAISYNHAIWGGFIFTETLGILMLTLALWSLWANRNVAEAWFANRDIATGMLFALAALTRYEYIVLLVPAAFLAGSKLCLKRTSSIVATNLVLVFLVLALLHPFTGGFLWVWDQLKSFVIILGASLVAILLSLGAVKKYKTKLPRIEMWACRVALLLLALGIVFVVLDQQLYPGLRQFAQDDFALCLAALFGLFVLLTGNRQNQRIGLLLLAGILILLAGYYRVNPGMERYVTHLSPLLLVAGGYGILHFIKFKPRAIVLLFIFLGLSWQGMKTWDGLRGVDNGIWYKPGYEEISAKKLKSKTGNTDMLITSTPEPYYLLAGSPTQSIADSFPYIYANLPKQEKITIVEDENMRRIFPNFSNFVQKNLNPYKVNEYWVNAPVRYTTYIAPEQKPVTVYQINAQKLKNLLDTTQHNR